MSILQQTQPNVHDVLRAIGELEKLPEVQAYIALKRSLEDRPWPQREDRA